MKVPNFIEITCPFCNHRIKVDKGSSNTISEICEYCDKPLLIVVSGSE